MGDLDVAESERDPGAGKEVELVATLDPDGDEGAVSADRGQGVLLELVDVLVVSEQVLAATELLMLRRIGPPAPTSRLYGAHAHPLVAGRWRLMRHPARAREQHRRTGPGRDPYPH